MKNRGFVIWLIIVVIVVLFFLNYKSLLGLVQKNYSSPIVVQPTPTTVAIEDKEVHSLDGTMKVIMKSKKDESGLTTYSFFTADISGKNEKYLFARTVGQGQSMVIPENSWSPDNSYLFLRENKSDFFDILVFKASGESFSDGKEYIDVLPLFDNNKIKYNIRDITGWDSPTLLHVYTEGPPYWFDVTTRSFIQLVRR